MHNSRIRSDNIIKIRQRIGKQCSICLKYKPLSEFGKDKKNRDGVKLACRPCDAEYQRDYRASQPKKPPKPGRRISIAAGTQYNHLTIVREDGHIGEKRAFIATCVCGSEVRATLRSMMRGDKRCCGCQLDEKFQKIQASLKLRDKLKVCGKCNEEKPLTQFQGKRSRVGGVLHRIYPDECKSCQSLAIVPWGAK